MHLIIRARNNPHNYRDLRLRGDLVFFLQELTAEHKDGNEGLNAEKDWGAEGFSACIKFRVGRG